jgi:ABC-type Fe3+-hydroxamate transport system substrate-binding protein
VAPTSSTTSTAVGPWVNWEDVVDRNPEYIVIIDYGEPDAQGKIDFLKGQPELADVDAIQNDIRIAIGDNGDEIRTVRRPAPRLGS